MLIQRMRIEILRFLLQRNLIHLSVKMGLQLKLLFGVVGLLVMDVLFNPMIQDLCIFLSLPLDINNRFICQWGYKYIPSTSANVNYPIVFPNRTFVVVGSNRSTPRQVLNVVNIYKNYFVADFDGSGTGSTYWISLGY